MYVYDSQALFKVKIIPFASDSHTKAILYSQHWEIFIPSKAINVCMSIEGRLPQDQGDDNTLF